MLSIMLNKMKSLRYTHTHKKKTCPLIVVTPKRILPTTLQNLKTRATMIKQLDRDVKEGDAELLI